MLLFILPIIVVTVIVVAYLVLSKPKTEEENKEEQLKKEEKQEKEQQKLRPAEQKQENQQRREYENQQNRFYQQELAKTLERKNIEKDTKLDDTIKEIRNTVYKDDNLILKNSTPDFNKFIQEFKQTDVFKNTTSYVHDDVFEDILKNNNDATILIQLHNHLKKFHNMYDVVLKLHFLQWLHNYTIEKLDKTDNYNNLKKDVISTISIDLNVPYAYLNNTINVQKELERLRKYVFEIKKDFKPKNIETHINKIKPQVNRIITDKLNELLRKDDDIHDEFHKKYNIEFTYDEKNDVSINIERQSLGSYYGDFSKGGGDAETKPKLYLGNMISIILKNNIGINQTSHIQNIFKSLKIEKQHTEEPVSNDEIQKLFNTGFDTNLLNTYDEINNIKYYTSQSHVLSKTHCATLFNFEEIKNEYDKLTYVFEHVRYEKDKYRFYKEQIINFTKTTKKLPSLYENMSTKPIHMLNKLQNNRFGVSKNVQVSKMDYDMLLKHTKIFNKNEEINKVHLIIISLYKMWLMFECNIKDNETIEYRDKIIKLSDKIKILSKQLNTNIQIIYEIEILKDLNLSQNKLFDLSTKYIKLFIQLLEVYFDMSQSTPYQKAVEIHIKDNIIKPKFKEIFYKEDLYTYFERSWFKKMGFRENIKFKSPENTKIIKINEESIVYKHSNKEMFINLDYSHTGIVIYDENGKYIEYDFEYDFTPYDKEYNDRVMGMKCIQNTWYKNCTTSKTYIIDENNDQMIQIQNEQRYCIFLLEKLCKNLCKRINHFIKLNQISSFKKLKNLKNYSKMMKHVTPSSLLINAKASHKPIYDKFIDVTRILTLLFATKSCFDYNQAVVANECAITCKKFINDINDKNLKVECDTTIIDHNEKITKDNIYVYLYFFIELYDKLIEAYFHIDNLSTYETISKYFTEKKEIIKHVCNIYKRCTDQIQYHLIPLEVKSDKFDNVYLLNILKNNFVKCDINLNNLSQSSSHIFNRYECGNYVLKTKINKDTFTANAKFLEEIYHDSRNNIIFDHIYPFVVSIDTKYMLENKVKDTNCYSLFDYLHKTQCRTTQYTPVGIVNSLVKAVNFCYNKLEITHNDIDIKNIILYDGKVYLSNLDKWSKTSNNIEKNIQYPSKYMSLTAFYNRNIQTYDKQYDYYSVGCIIYEILQNIRGKLGTRNYNSEEYFHETIESLLEIRKNQINPEGISLETLKNELEKECIDLINEYLKHEGFIQNDFELSLKITKKQYAYMLMLMIFMFHKNKIIHLESIIGTIPEFNVFYKDVVLYCKTDEQSDIKQFSDMPEIKRLQLIISGIESWKQKDEDKLYQTQRIRLTYYNSDIMKKVIQKLLFDNTAYKGNKTNIINYYKNQGTSQEFLHETDTKIDENNSYYIHEINVLKSLNIINDKK